MKYDIQNLLQHVDCIPYKCESKHGEGKFTDLLKVPCIVQFIVISQISFEQHSIKLNDFEIINIAEFIRLEVYKNCIIIKI